MAAAAKRELSAVVWRANPLGYSVEVYRRGELVGRQRCGNHAFDPRLSVPPSSPDALSKEDLRSLARKLAFEMADAFGIPYHSVLGEASDC